MAVSKTQSVGQDYNTLLGKVQKQADKKKVNIKVFDDNMDGKLSIDELKMALTRMPKLVVNNGEVQINDYDKKGNLVQEILKSADGEFINKAVNAYDKNNKKVSTTFTSSDGIKSETTYKYHKNGVLKSMESKVNSGEMFTETYFENGNMESVSYTNEDGEVVICKADKNGNMIES